MRALGTLVVVTVDGGVKGADARVGVLVIGAQGSADVLDLSVVPLSGLTLTQLPGLGLDPVQQKTQYKLLRWLCLWL